MKTPSISVPVTTATKDVKRDPELRDRIATYQFDDPEEAKSFSLRLALENGWTRAFALRVIEEYRRFVYLACIAPQEMTPSEEVDQAWHQHLVYSRMYWEDFCPNVLRQPLHHGPTVGGKSEDERYRDNYEGTLAFYERVFGSAPPPDIWPPSRVRFGSQYVRINRSLFSLVPNRTISVFGIPRYPRPNLLLWLLFLLYFVAFAGVGRRGNGIESILMPVFIAGLFTWGLYMSSRLLAWLGNWIRAPIGEEVFTQALCGFAVKYVASGGDVVPASMRPLRYIKYPKTSDRSSYGTNSHAHPWLHHNVGWSYDGSGAASYTSHYGSGCSSGGGGGSGGSGCGGGGSSGGSSGCGGSSGSSGGSSGCGGGGGGSSSGGGY